MRAPGGYLIAVHERGELRFLMNGEDAVASRTGSMIRMIRSIVPELQPRPLRFILVAQHWDVTLHEVASIAYGRRRGQTPAVRLVPDAFFFDSKGYEDLRRASAGGCLPAWDDRQDVVFWRGSANPPWDQISPEGAPIERLEQVPRVAMCLALKNHPGTDVAIMDPGDCTLLVGEAEESLAAAGIYRPGISMPQHALYRYLLDADGYGNAWSLFEKLLLGCCVLKVISPFEQWFYNEIAEWEHFVPVRWDLSDLVEKIEWCREHEAAARSIAQRGQVFALGHTYEVARGIAALAVRDCCIPF